MNGGPLRPFQQIGYIAGAHVLGRFAIDGDDDVTGVNASLIGGSSREGVDNDDFIVAWADGHTHAVVLAALVFAHQGIRLGIEEVRVWVQRMQHAGDRPVVDRLVGVYGLGVILFDERINVSELLEAVLDVGV